MTGAVARALQPADRGLLKVGRRADGAIFDPADFNDLATYDNPINILLAIARQSSSMEWWSLKTRLLPARSPERSRSAMRWAMSIDGFVDLGPPVPNMARSARAQLMSAFSSCGTSARSLAQSSLTPIC